MVILYFVVCFRFTLIPSVVSSVRVKTPDEIVHLIADSDDPLKTTDQTRTLGLIVCLTSLLNFHPWSSSQKFNNKSGTLSRYYIVCDKLTLGCKFVTAGLQRDCCNVGITN